MNVRFQLRHVESGVCFDPISNEKIRSQPSLVEGDAPWESAVFFAFGSITDL